MSSEAIALKLDEAVAGGANLTRSLKFTFSGAITVANVAAQIRASLTPEMVQMIMQIKETDFGWRTDGKSYTPEQIRDAWVDAALKGAVPVNNEVNIISGRAYLCKNYFTRMIREYPGLTDFVAIPGKVVMLPTGALVEYTATWKLNGKPMTLARTKDSAIPVRLNAGMGADGALGKAERKIKCAVFSLITGSTFDDDGDDFIDEAKQPTIHVREKEPAMPQNVLPDPTAAKAGTTQTKATTEKIKKTAVAKVEPTAPAAPVQEEAAQEQSEADETGSGEKMPWETGDGGDESQEQAEATETAPTAAEAVKPVEETKVVGWVKNTETGAMEEVRKPKAEVDAKPKKEKKEKPAEKPPENAASGEIEVDKIGVIASIKAKGKDEKGVPFPPYTITSQDATQYITDSKDMAMKAKGYKDASVPVDVSYVRDASGRYVIVDVLPEGSAPTDSHDM